MVPQAHPVGLLAGARCLAYDFGPGHPLAPVRVELAEALIEACGLLGTHAMRLAPPEIDDGPLRRVHDASYVAAVRAASRDPADVAPGSGLGPGDTPAFAGVHEAARWICASSLEAAGAVLRGDLVHAFNPSGGLHHAMPDRASGFCVYNDVAVAIDALLDGGAERVCYVDIDVHHGDGVERIFWDDRRVMTISLHESGEHLFPGTGAAADIGGPDALGSAVNVPFAPGTPGDVWLETFEAVVAPLVTAFAPDVLVTQLGCDAHVRDPLAHLQLTVDDYGVIVARLHELAHEVADGRWVACGGGGYRLVDVVPRVWTAAFAEMSQQRLAVEIPMEWRERARARTGEVPPASFTDDPVTVADALHDHVGAVARRAVDEIRARVFPLHGC